MTALRATVPGPVFDRAQSAFCAVRKLQSVMSSRSATEASLIQAINSAERALPELAHVARDARRMLTELRARGVG